jgi:hypothetical protein
VSKKLPKPWTGPRIVLEKLNDVNFRLKLKSGRTQVVHINRLKLFPSGREVVTAQNERTDWEDGNKVSDASTVLITYSDDNFGEYFHSESSLCSLAGSKRLISLTRRDARGFLFSDSTVDIVLLCFLASSKAQSIFWLRKANRVLILFIILGIISLTSVAGSERLSSLTSREAGFEWQFYQVSQVICDL